MKPLLAKVRPAAGFARLAHIVLLALLPLLVFILVRIDFIALAFGVILLSKWRMFAVKPRFWPANIRANSVDLMVGVAVVVFMMHTNSQTWQIIWAVAYLLWLTVLKRRSETLLIAIQALIGFLGGLTALFVVGDGAPSLYLVVGAGLICYLAAHHFFDAFEETYTRLLSYTWGFFGSGLTWVLAHWLLYYPANGLVAQPTLLLLTIGYALAAIYYLDHTDRLSDALRKQFIFIMCAITLIILRFSDWGDKIV
jgi:hypothetical protein